MKAALVRDEDKFASTQKMVKLGFRRKIIVHSLNASDRVIDFLRKEFHLSDVSIGRLKHSETLLNTTHKKVEATNFMSIYLRRSKDPNNSDNIVDVVSAFEIYRELNLKFRPEEASKMMIDANEAWTLARDFRAEEIRMVRCYRCDLSFISPQSCDRPRKKHICPFCSDTEAENESS